MLVQGFASTSKLDLARDIVMPGAFDDSIREKGLGGPKGIKFLAQHDRNQPIGRITKLEQRTGGLWMEGEIDESISYAADLANAAKANGGLNYSIGYRLIPEFTEPKEQPNGEVWWYLHKVNLHEVSIVTFPCNDDCMMVEPKSAMELIEDMTAQLKALNQPDDPMSRVSARIAELKQLAKGL